MPLRSSTGVVAPVGKSKVVLPAPVRRVGAVRVRAVAEPTTKPRLSNWSLNSWRSKPIVQQPEYPDRKAVEAVNAEISRMPPLIFAGECRTLQARLAKAAVGEAFCITGGDCAESFDAFNANRIRDYYRVMLQMSIIMAFGGGVPVIKVTKLFSPCSAHICLQIRCRPRMPASQQVTEHTLFHAVTLPSHIGPSCPLPKFTCLSQLAHLWLVEIFLHLRVAHMCYFFSCPVV